MAHQRKSQSLNTVVSMKPVRDGAGAKVVRYHWNVLVLRIIYDFGSEVPRLKPGVLVNSVETVELMEHLHQSGISCIACQLVVSGHERLRRGSFPCGIRTEWALRLVSPCSANILRSTFTHEESSLSTFLQVLLSEAPCIGHLDRNRSCSRS